MTDGPVPDPGAGPSALFAGLVLAAGEGSRLGRPKGLLERADGTSFVAHAVGVVASGGAAPVFVAVGAAGDDVSLLVPPSAVVVRADDWAEGMGASLRAGLRALSTAAGTAPDAAPGTATAPVAGPDAAGVDAVDAVVVGLVDTPGVTAEAVRRLGALASPSVLARCSYDGVPGHPVLIGRDHWAGAAAAARGDQGARAYLRGRDVTLVEVADVADGADVDTSEQYVEWRDDRA